MNFYSSDAFCEAFAAAYFPSDNVKSQFFELGGQLWRIPVINQTTPVTEMAFHSKMLDFYEPRSPDSIPNDIVVKPIRYIPQVSHAMVTAEAWLNGTLSQTYEPAPTILWKDFKDWPAFVQFVQARKSKKFFTDSRRRRNKLEEAVGPLHFVLSDQRPEVLATCMQWKSEQYRSTGEFDDFSQGETVRLFEQLAARNLLMVSSLNSQMGTIAIDINLYADGRLYSWISAYDRKYSNYSPGRLLLLASLESSFKQGHREFDFLIGDESYKWIYATHTRLIAPLGQPPLITQARNLARDSIKPIVQWGLRPFPGLKGQLKTLVLLSQKN